MCGWQSGLIPFASIYVLQKNYPSSTAVVRVIDGSEPPEFTRLFMNWTAAEQGSVKAASLSEKFDALVLMQRPQLAAEYQLIDDGTGDMSIYRVTSNCDIVEISKRKNISLFSSDCYIIHYIVTVRNEHNRDETRVSVRRVSLENFKLILFSICRFPRIT